MKDNLGVDFANIRGLAIGASVSASAVRVEDLAPRQQLFTLDANNQLQPVNLTIEGTGNPTELYDTPRFVLIVVSGVTYQEQTCASVLVRKSDSALFCVPVAPAGPGVRNAARVQWGSTGDLVTLDSGNALHRLEATDDTLQLTTLRFDGAELVNFAVNAADDVMVNLRQDNGTIIRVYPRTGAPLFITARNQSCVFPGLVGSRDYYLALGWSDRTTVDRVVGREDGTYADPANVWMEGASVWDNCGVVYRDSSRLIVRASTRLLEVVNPSGTPRVLSVQAKVARGGAFFNWGQDSEGRAFVTRYDLPELTPVELLTAAPYRLGKVDVSPTGEVSFVATRLSDGVRVVGTLRNGTLNVSELTQSQPEIVTLVRIN
jgi:dipeptidyl aminopeptidase/acylaminoacyl peptidase